MALDTSVFATTKSASTAAPQHVSGGDEAVPATGGGGSGQDLAFKLLALAAGIFLARFLLGLVRYVLDFALCVLVVGGLVAVFRPGPKDGVVSTVLAQLGAIVDPLYSALADHSKVAAAGPLKVIARQLGLSSGVPARA
ncbi:hypothetical protein GGI21_004732 [Coemansia aciculifera]|uniref:Uncharacterized protein n=1 Tax=Coemansia aciculifera TaxID=417176 RepID=A0ACC1MAM7_9FUNG|nr:hypothetical protein IWW38_000205 [Coemansia aciculifera]KAJ2901003.1 hypothetical protein GGI21_004732 [Coemansia aciculifera]